MQAGAGITFRPLQKEDFPLLAEWLNQPHMRSFYQPAPITLAEVTEKFTPRVEGREPTFSHIALLNERPIGKIQSYKNLSYPDYAEEVGLNGGISLDLFIGEPDCLHKGLGRSMLAQYLNVAFGIFSGETEGFICHEKTNAGAIRCSKTAGFKHLRNVVEGGKPCELLVFKKEPMILAL